MATDDDDPKVKEVLGQTSEEDLARWFSLPSFQQVEEQKQAEAAADPDQAAARRAKVFENIDPQLVEAIHLRTDENPRNLIYFKPNLEVHIDTDFGNIDHALLEKQLALAEPRIYDLPPELEDDLNECTPQALLRDLHRPEDTFEKQFEIAEVEEQERPIDVVAEIERAMTMSWKLPPFVNQLVEARRVLADLAADRQRPWTEYLPKLRNRRVQE